MKKFLLIAVLAIVALALGANWYYTREVRQQLDRIARATSMFGELTYASVRLSPDGEIHVNELAFTPRQARSSAVSVERIALDAGGLAGIVSLKDRLSSGQLPPELGIRVERLSASLDALGAASPAGQPQASSGLMFAAAGCNGRTGFDLADLARMDYADWAGDLEFRYRLIDRGRQLEFSTRVRTVDAAEVSMEAMLDLLAASTDVAAVVNAFQQAELRAFSMIYDDLGFYDRMLSFCARQTDMSREAYVDHHLEAWRARWAQFGVRPDERLVEAYREFVASPDRLRLETRSNYTVPLVGVEAYSPPELLARMETMLVVDGGEPVPVQWTEIAPEAVAGNGDQPAATPAAGARPAVRPAPPAGLAPSTPRAGSRGPDWVAVEPSGLSAYVDRPVRVETDGGRRLRGRLTRVEPDAIHIRIQGTGGYYVRPVARASISSVSVRADAG